MAEEESAPKIVCVTLNPAVDRTFEVRGLEIGQHAKGRLLSIHAAGKAVNVAHVLQHLEQACILTGFVGESERVMFEDSFDSKFVQAQLFSIAKPTRENFTLVDVEKGTETHIRDVGPEISADEQARLLKKLKILAGPGVWMVFAGSLPLGIDAEGFHKMLQAIVAKGAKVVLDSSEGALGAVRKLPVWLIKPNRAELAELSGRKTESVEEIVQAAWSMRDAAEVVLASAGADGCFLVEGGRVLRGRLKELPKRITSTVGSGDSLLGGYLAARARNLPAEECVRRAVAVATSTCFHFHAGEVDREQVESLMPGVVVEQMRV